MANKKENTTVNPAAKKYARIGIVAAAVVAIGAIGIWAVSGTRGGAANGASVDVAMTEITSDAANGADLRIAIIRMDGVQTNANVLKDLQKQKESYESKLRADITREQKALEKEKAELEKSQGVLAPDALQRRVVDYQKRVAQLQRDLAERAQSIEVSFQKALNEVQAKHLDPIIEGTIAKKKLSMVIDGRLARIGADAQNLDITDEVTNALNKKVSKVQMEKPAGF